MNVRDVTTSKPHLQARESANTLPERMLSRASSVMPEKLAPCGRRLLVTNDALAVAAPIKAVPVVPAKPAHLKGTKKEDRTLRPGPKPLGSERLLLGGRNTCDLADALLVSAPFNTRVIPSGPAKPEHSRRPQEEQGVLSPRFVDQSTLADIHAKSSLSFLDRLQAIEIKVRGHFGDDSCLAHFCGGLRDSFLAPDQADVATSSDDFERTLQLYERLLPIFLRTPPPNRLSPIRWCKRFLPG